MIVWIWVASFLTLCIFSFLYRENPFYRLAEHLYVGVANGYAVAIIWHRLLMPNLIRPVYAGEIWLVIPLVIGLLYITRFIPRISWLVRIPIAITMGYYSGAAIPASIQARILKQMEGTILTRASFASFSAGVAAVLVLIGVITTITYFFFSREQKGATRVVSRIGIGFIMVSFGATFGYTVMARISLLIGRLQFLLGTWLGVVK
jgi:hypothetical protein